MVSLSPWDLVTLFGHFTMRSCHETELNAGSTMSLLPLLFREEVELLIDHLSTLAFRQDVV